MQDPLTYYDRSSGRVCRDTLVARGFLDWSYNTRPGRLAMDAIFSRKLVSRVYGWYHRRRWSRRKIRKFVERFHVNMAESKRSLEDFESFNDFFTREIDLTRRPVDRDPHTCVAPSDGRVLGYRRINADTTFHVKSGTFHLRRFLGDEVVADSYTGGSLVISRLYLTDYHHFHFPDSGIPGPARPIPGRYHAVSPYSIRALVPFYVENHRMVSLFDSDHFGRVAMVEIGALTVGAIRQTYRPGEAVARGERKGYFELGGSTVVLVFPPGVLRLSDDIDRNTRDGIETYVRMGQPIGYRTDKADEPGKDRKNSCSSTRFE